MKPMINANRRNSRYILSGNSDYKGVRIDVSLGEIDEKTKKSKMQSVYAYEADDGTIKCAKNDVDEVRQDVIRRIRLINYYDNGFKIGCFMMMVVMLFGSLICFILKEFNLARVLLGTVYLCTGAFFTAPLWSQMFLRILGNEKTIRFCRFHAAEHSVINAYFDLGRVPTLDEIRGYSMFAYNCGATEVAKKGWYWFGAFIFMSLPGIAALVFCAIFILISILAHFFEKFVFLQAIAIKKPTDKEYEVAIKALEEVLILVEHA